MNDGKVAIFSSCAGYGTYTPALTLKKELSSIGVDTEFFVFETFFAEEQKKQFLTYRTQFHEDFRFAAMATGIASKTLHDTNLSFLSEEQLKKKKIRKYVVMYGLWVPVLLQLGIDARQIVCVQLDVGESPSWRAVKELCTGCETIWMLGKDGTIPTYKFQDAATKAANKSLVIHGGGWGITNYVDILDKIQREYEIHVIHSSARECGRGYHSYYTPINWLPEKERPEYPPLNRYPDNAKADFYDLCSHSCAIISKPGGGTCADSLRLHTPLVYLQGMARHEEINALHFRRLGYACSFKEWEDTGFSAQKLEEMRENIAADMASAELISHHLK